MPILVVHLSRTTIVCACGVRIVPDPSLREGTVLHECPDCLILQCLPPEENEPRPDTVVDVPAE